MRRPTRCPEPPWQVGDGGSAGMETERVVQTFYDAVRRQDVAGIASLLAPDLRHRVYATTSGRSPFSGEFDGIAAVTEHFRRVRETWIIERMTVYQLTVDGGHAAAVVEVDATSRGAQRRIATRATHFLRLEDQLVAEFEVYFSETRTYRPLVLTTGAFR